MIWKAGGELHEAAFDKEDHLHLAAHAGKKIRTRREKFLAKMEAVVLWARLTALIEPHQLLARHELTRPIFGGRCLIRA